MAEKTVISIEVEGTDQAINSIKELKAELKAAQSAALNGDGKAAKRVAELKDKMDDLKDTTKSLQGSGVEKISSGFSMLGQGFKDFDFDKIKTGFKGVGSAMSAIPIFLIIEGISYLVQNWKELSEGNGLVAKSLQFLGDIFTSITDVIYEFTDAIGLTNTELDKQGDAIKGFAEKSNAALNEQSQSFDRQIAVAKASGKNTVELEKQKQQAIIDTNYLIAKQIEAFVRAGGELDAEKSKQLTASLDLIKNAKVQEYVITENDDKAKQEQYKKHLEEQNKIRQDNEKLISENTIAGAQIDKDNRKLIADEIAAEEAEKLKLAKERDEQEYLALVKKIQDEKDAAAQKLLIEKYLQEQKQTLRNADLNNAAAIIGLFKQLTSKNKDLQKVALVAENGLAIAKMIIANSASNVAVTAQGAALAVATGGASVAAAAALVIRNNISTGIGVAASIAATAKALGALGGGDAGSAPTLSGGSGGGSPSMPSGNGTPSIAAPQQNTTTFTGNNNNNFNQPPIKTYVVETDLRNSTNTIDKIKDQATF